MNIEIGVSEFKSKALDLLSKTKSDKTEYTITKHGEPIAKVIPIKSTEEQIFGSLKGQLASDEDIVEHNFADQWDAAN